MKIVFLTKFAIDGRFTAIVCEGLLAHADVEPLFLEPVRLFGKEVAPAIPPGKLRDELKNADFIFLVTLAYRDDRFFDNWDIVKFLNTEKLWNKVVYLDHHDDNEIDDPILDICRLYMKRSWPIGSERHPREETDKLKPINYGALYDYFERFPTPTFKDWARPINFGAFFHKYNRQIPHAARRRANLMEVLEDEYKFPGENRIGYTTNDALGDHGTSMSIYDPLTEDHLWGKYIKMLHQCKIIFHAAPYYHDGENRPWELLSSGALGILDRGYIPTPYWLEDGKHAIIYDALNKNSIRKAVDKALYYLDRPTERWKIAKAGYDHVLKYHMPVNRIDQILGWLT